MAKKKYFPVNTVPNDIMHDALTSSMFDVVTGTDAEKMTKISAAIIYSKTGSVKETASVVGVEPSKLVSWMQQHWWTLIYQRADVLRSQSVKIRLRNLGLKAVDKLMDRIDNGEDHVFVDKESGLVTKVHSELSTDMVLQIAKLGVAFLQDAQTTATIIANNLPNAAQGPASPENAMVKRLTELAQACAGVATAAINSRPSNEPTPINPENLTNPRPVIEGGK